MTIIKSQINSNSFFKCDNSNCVLVAGTMSISANDDIGLSLNGPVAIPGPFTNIRFSNMFKFNSMLSLGLPSTVLTPISTFEIDFPVKEAASMASLMALVLGTVA